VAATVALGGFLVGFDATVISGRAFIRDYFGLGGSSGSLQLGWAVSCLGWGAMAGTSWPHAERPPWAQEGIAADLHVVPGICTDCRLSTRFAVFVIARICGGLGVGLRF